MAYWQQYPRYCKNGADGTCETCAWWDSFDRAILIEFYEEKRNRSDGAPMGQCRRKSPVKSESQHKFPVTEFYEYCGEYEYMGEVESME